MKETAKPHLSPSQIRKIKECPAAWYMSRQKDIKPRGNTRGRDRGTAVHLAIEDAISGTDRSERIAKLLVEKPWEPSLTGYTKLQEYEAAIAAWNKLAPTLDLSEVTAERKVTGEIAGIPIRGILDCVTREGELTVVYDWKTGSPRKEDREQMNIYARILGTEGKEYRLAYLRTGTVEIVDYPGDDVVEMWVREASEAIERYYEEGHFPAVPGNLCDHCDYKYCCPAWEA